MAAPPEESEMCDLSRWADLPETEPEDAAGRGEHPSTGYPGKLQAARNHAPVGVSEEEIQAVAQEAFDREEQVERVWSDHVHHDMSEYE